MCCEVGWNYGDSTMPPNMTVRLFIRNWAGLNYFLLVTPVIFNIFCWLHLWFSHVAIDTLMQREFVSIFAHYFLGHTPLNTRVSNSESLLSSSHDHLQYPNTAEWKPSVAPQPLSHSVTTSLASPSQHADDMCKETSAFPTSVTLTVTCGPRVQYSRKRKPSAAIR